MGLLRPRPKSILPVAGTFYFNNTTNEATYWKIQKKDPGLSMLQKKIFKVSVIFYENLPGGCLAMCYFSKITKN